MSDVGKVATLVNTFLRIWESRPGRLKRQALHAAKQYIEINETGKFKEKVLNTRSKRKWLVHYKKQVKAWG